MEKRKKKDLCVCFSVKGYQIVGASAILGFNLVVSYLFLKLLSLGMSLRVSIDAELSGPQDGFGLLSQSLLRDKLEAILHPKSQTLARFHTFLEIQKRSIDLDFILNVRELLKRYEKLMIIDHHLRLIPVVKRESLQSSTNSSAADQSLFEN